MDNRSAGALWQQTSAILNNLLSRIDNSGLERSAERSLRLIKRLSVDIRLDIRDYEMADNKAEQVRHKKVALKRLEELTQAILKASEQDIFGPVDVAQLSAMLSQITEKL